MAFTEADLRGLPCFIQLSPDAQNYLLDALAAPSRNVGLSGYSSVGGAFPSRKMGWSVPFESRSGELSLAIHLEFNPDVIAYLDQPPKVDVLRTNAAGKTYRTTYTPDFLVIYRDEIVAVQVKSAAQIERLLEACTTDWRQVDEEVRDLAADLAYESFQLQHTVISSADLNRVRTANLSHLLHLRRRGASCADAIRAAVDRALSRRAVCTIEELASAAGTVDISPIHHLVDTGDLVCDLDQQLLTDIKSCLVARNARTLEEVLAGMRPKRDGESMPDLAHVPSEAAAERALNNKASVDSGRIYGSTGRWKRLIRDGVKRGLSAFQAVTPRFHDQGNREPKRPLVVLAFAEDAIRTKYATGKRPSIHSVYREYKVDAEKWHPALRYVSKPTFRSLVKNLWPIIAGGRGGRRAAHAAESPTDVELRAIKPLVPFELATCDHCLLKISCVVMRKGKRTYCRRPWLTVLRDVASGVVLAFWLSFSQPSSVACAAVIRRCARVHGRLPQGIVFDRGKEFGSVFFRSLLAHFDIMPIDRPSSHPRYGSEAERYFGVFKNKWLSSRPGNRVDYRETRSVSGSHSPDNTAELTVLDVLRDLVEFNTWHANWGSDSQTVSPQELFDAGLARFPFCGVPAVIDRDFDVITSVDIGKYSLDPARGMKIGRGWFWAPQLSTLRLPTRSIEVRKDPEDSSVVYAIHGTGWIRCLSSAAPHFAVMDPLRRLAESIVETKLAEVFAKAVDDADRELVAAQRRSDEARQGRETFDAPTESDALVESAASRVSDPSDSGPASSVWDKLRGMTIEPVRVSKWGAK